MVKAKGKGKPRNRKRAEKKSGFRGILTVEEKQQQKDDDIATVVSMSKTKPWDLRSEVFKDLEVGSAIVQERLENFDDIDAKTTITSKTFKGLNIRKKDKRKIKKHLFARKMALVEEGKRLKQDVKKSKKQKKVDRGERQQTEVTGDMMPLLESLPSVQDYVSKCQAQHKPQRVQPKSKGQLKAKQFRRIAKGDMDLFKQVLAVPEFKADPGKAIQTHLQNKIALEKIEDSTEPPSMDTA